MKKKMWLCLGLALLLAAGLSGQAFALTAQDVADGGQALAGEKQTIKQALTAQGGALPLSSPLDFDAAYKVYSFSALDAAAEYQKTNTVESLLSGEYHWIVPTQAGDLVTVKRSADKAGKASGDWEIVGGTLQKTDAEAADNPQRIPAAALYAAVQSRAGEAAELKYIDAPRYYTTFAYVKDGDREYLAPYSARPAWTGLENGKLYPAGEVMDAFDRAFGGLEPEENGGAGKQADAGWLAANGLWLGIAGGVLAAGLMGFGLFRIRASKKERDF